MLLVSLKGLKVIGEVPLIFKEKIAAADLDCSIIYV
jgi:hypothetical protein